MDQWLTALRPWHSTVRCISMTYTAAGQYPWQHKFHHALHSYTQFCFLLERCSVECRKTKTKVLEASQNKGSHANEAVGSKSHHLFWFYFWFVEKVVLDFLANQIKSNQSDSKITFDTLLTHWKLLQFNAPINVKLERWDGEGEAYLRILTVKCGVKRLISYKSHHIKHYIKLLMRAT